MITRRPVAQVLAPAAVTQLDSALRGRAAATVSVVAIDDPQTEVGDEDALSVAFADPRCVALDASLRRVPSRRPARGFECSPSVTEFQTPGSHTCLPRVQHELCDGDRRVQCKPSVSRQRDAALRLAVADSQLVA